MNAEILKAVLEEASALASCLPEGVREVAFAKAFDVLVRERAIEAKSQERPGPRQTRAGRYRSGTAGLRSGRVGPKLALGQLLDSGYFAHKRGLPEIQSHLRDSYGHDYGSNELSISLLRLIRDARLIREKNLAGQYEYWAEELHGRPDPADRLGRAKAHARLLTDGRGR